MRRKEIMTGRFGWCWHCKENVNSVLVEQDYGQINDDHLCPECGERVSEPKYEEENES